MTSNSEDLKRHEGFALNPNFCFTLLGTFVIYLWSRPSRRSILLVVIIAAVLYAACLKQTGGFGTYFGSAYISSGAFLGIASLLVLAGEITQSHGDRRKFLMRTFYGGSVFPLLGILVGYSIPLNLWLRPQTYDAFLLAFDASLGFQPSFFLGSLLLKSAFAWGITTVVYYALPLTGMTVYASYRMQKKQPVATLQLLLSFMIVGFSLYSVYPAVGPNHAYPNIYPNYPPSISQISLRMLSVPDSPRNCMPSLHLGVALLAFWNSRIWPRWGRLASALFLLLTAFATLALGEHYLVDLTVALPFCLLFQALWTRALPVHSTQRKLCILAGALMTAAWFLLLRYGVALFLRWPGLSWSLTIFTIASTLILERSLAKAAWSAVNPPIASGLGGTNSNVASELIVESRG